jgi:zinc protease
MRTNRATAILRGILAAGACASSAGAQQARLDRHLEQTTLDNGLQVVVAENPATPVATVLVAVRTGAFTQEASDEGIAHMYEHLLFRSYAGSPAAFAREVGRLGGEYNGFTTEEAVSYFVAVPSKRTNDAIKLVARLVEEARFGQADLNDERPVVLDELERNESDPERAFARRVDRQVWGAAWSRKDVSGDSVTLAGLTLARLREIYGRYYRPNNAALIVTGDVSAPEVFQAAREQFARWERGPDPFAEHPVPPIAPPGARQAVVVGGAVDAVTILLEWPGPSVGSDTAATYAADVLFGILDAPTSAFQHRLVDSGLFQSVQCSYRTLSHSGPITIRGQTTPGRTREALLTLLDEVDRMDQLDGVTPDDLEYARRSREVEAALEYESAAAAAPALALLWSAAGLDYFRTYQAHADAQTPADLRRFAQAYVAGRPLVIGVLGPAATAAQIGAWLRGAQAATARKP